MDGARLIVNVLLATAALSTVAHHSRTSGRLYQVAAFLTTEGSSRRLPVKVVAEVLVASQPIYTVTATAYQAVAEQTDDEPFVTADNSRIQPRYSSKTHWMALSQDLLAPWGGQFQYGDKVRVQGISPQLDGVYTVHDTMNRRHRHCMDILTHPREKFDIFTKGVKIQLVVLVPAPVAARPRRDTNAMAGPRLRTSARPARQRANQRTRGSEQPPAYFASAIL